MKKIIIAVDGYSSCGKSTVAKEIAQKLNYTYIDSGAMYRCVTLYALEHGIISNAQINEERLNLALGKIQIAFSYNPATGKSETLLNQQPVEDKIRSLEVSKHVSPISKIGFVRLRMVELQREMGKKKGIVMDGRDIGTVVFPNADLKLFMTADPEIRAKRRYDELKKAGSEESYEAVKKNIIERDFIDTTRTESPLKKADDALIIDNSFLSKTEQMELIIKIVEKTLSKQHKS